MELVVSVVLLVALVLACSWVCERLELPEPLVLIGVGIAVSYLPGVPEFHLDPDLVLLGLLPPLLFSASIQTSLIDFKANRRVIILLSVGLVVFTTVGVGLLVHALLPSVGWAGAFAIGAVVAPPDAVAATAIGRRIGLPRRIVTILEGESLLNDATALVALRTAIAATVVAVTARSVLVDFIVAAGGGILVGLAFYALIGGIRRHLSDPVLDSGLSFLTPFAAYVVAEEIEASGVIAVVVAGLLLGHRAPVLQTAMSRLLERSNWRTIGFLLESSVFVIIGLQARSIISHAAEDTLSHGDLVVLCGLTLVAVIALRLAWVFGARTFLGKGRQRPPASYVLLVGWAGMRGVVTLAAAFTIPLDMPHRSVLLLIAFVVTVGTLFLQGLTLPWLARRLGVPPPDPAEDARARAELLSEAAVAGLAALDRMEQETAHPTAAVLRDRVERRDQIAWAHLAEDDDSGEVYARRRLAMLAAERERVLEIRSTGAVAHEVVEDVLGMLDVEESMLVTDQRNRERLRGEAQT